MNGAWQWVFNLWNDFLVFCTADLMFWFSAFLLACIALLVGFLRAKHR